MIYDWLAWLMLGLPFQSICLCPPQGPAGCCKGHNGVASQAALLGWDSREVFLMPMKPLSHAQRQGRTASDRAYDQTQRVADPALAQAKQVRSSARWRRVRALVLSANPLCADPHGWHAREGRVVAATQVDHMRGLAEGGAAFEESNLMPLCTHCHARKSAGERR